MKWLKYLWAGVGLLTPIWTMPVSGFIGHHPTLAAALAAAAATVTHIIADAKGGANAGN